SKSSRDLGGLPAEKPDARPTLAWKLRYVVKYRLFFHSELVLDKLKISLPEPHLKAELAPQRHLKIQNRQRAAEVKTCGPQAERSVLVLPGSESSYFRFLFAKKILLLPRLHVKRIF